MKKLNLNIELINEFFVPKHLLLDHDFIKCDIEGGEAEVFKDTEFFKYFRPRMIIELHDLLGTSTEQMCYDQLESLGYKITLFPHLQ